jgi:hypothetical protein
MKTIEVSDEVYAKLIELANEITTQDPRGTRMPHIFHIRDWKKVYDWGMNGDIHIWVNDYGTEIETVEEFKEYLGNNGYEIPENLDDLWNADYWWDMEEFIEEKNIELKQCSYSLEPVYINSFLTAKAAQEHLDKNYYHYHKNADVYLNHAWRNPEAEFVSEFLCGLVGKEMYT